jgi:hypothetical protein
MKRVLALALVLAMLGWTPAAHAVIGTIDEVPAASLLFPYFEVDLNNPNGLTTLISINNASATAILAHVTLWTDLSVHALDFLVYLTGYDVQTINLRDIIVSGNLPRTASAGQDPTDTISPKGPFSQDINFASCTGILPYQPGVLFPTYTNHLQALLTGKADTPPFPALCGGQNLGDNVARGYITVDTVNNCTLRITGDPGYFGPGGSGDVTNQNVLWGDFFIVNVPLNFAQGGPAVHIEASATNPQTSVPGQYTFYGRYTNIPWNADDNREPLATNFATRYLLGGTFSGGTSLLVWRDSKVNQQAFTCPATTGRPAWYPLGQEGIVIFDEQEHVSTPPGCIVSPCLPNQGLIPFPAEANRTRVGGPSLPVPFNFGWLYLNLNTTVTAAGNVPPEDPAAAQAWVIATYSANGQFAVAPNAIQLDNASSALHFVPGP